MSLVRSQTFLTHIHLQSDISSNNFSITILMTVTTFQVASDQKQDEEIVPSNA